jgi:hypothetical protein
MPPVSPLEIHLDAHLEQGPISPFLVLAFDVKLLEPSGAKSNVSFEIVVNSPDDLARFGSMLQRLSLVLSQAINAKAN